MIALIVGTLLAVAAMAYVLVPLFRPPVERTLHGHDETGGGSPVDTAPDGPAGLRERAVDALREIEFDRATGKLAEADYARLKARYTADAVAAMRAASEPSSTAANDSPQLAFAARAPSDDEVEAVIRRQREARPTCPTHGSRPEEDARYCSACGAWLGGACRRCGAAVRQPAARFCDDCGHVLAA